jgi:acetate kinase
MIILVFNAGSSSQKSCLYRLDDLTTNTPSLLWSADLDWTVAQKEGMLVVKSNGIQQKIEISEGDTASKVILNTLIQGETKVLSSLNKIDLVGHRVVHGGATYSQATLITEQVKQVISELIPLAPDHNPAQLAGINAVEKILPTVPQVAVFDTAFHTTIPEFAKVYPLPHKFHGISHQYCANRAAQILQQPLESLKIITCHLGNGCSLAAIKNGVCIDTTMGFSPLEGLMMGNRCGSIDPQIPLYLMQEYGLSIEDVNHILHQESGLKGVSGISGDMRTIFKAIADGNTQAQLAFDVYIHRLKSCIGAMIASLNGLDVLVFTGGVGENSSLVREKTCAGLTYLGLQLDLVSNNANPVDEKIATDESNKSVLVIHTQENLAIALLAQAIS